MVGHKYSWITGPSFRRITTAFLVPIPFRKCHLPFLHHPHHKLVWNLIALRSFIRNFYDLTSSPFLYRWNFVFFSLLTGSTSLDWMSTGLVSIPDSLPTVHSSEDWQAAFGFQPESLQTNSATHKPSPSSSPGVSSFNPDDFIDGEVYTNSRYATLAENATVFATSFLTDSPASKFMADFQQNSLRQRLVMQVFVPNSFQSYEPFAHVLYLPVYRLNKIKKIVIILNRMVRPRWTIYTIITMKLVQR